MRSMIRLLGAAAAAALLALTAPAQPPAATPACTITVPDMDCAGCAKKLGAALAKASGVARAEYDVKARTIKLTHKATETPPPKVLWEAIEPQQQQPGKLEPPGGTFTRKPTT